ncbi:hypothetical protein [Flavobacterium granuli]|uniref:Uncharacterized protein n=1 Tax=Flavobacterium granuli TaxID=280093 RepID=A0ABU1S3Q9_9FLAO|nr:hypothetical protein [Flavobacterium granuli]MDR6845577.1 hypothetical protein [Flavobacterium granuli]
MIKVYPLEWLDSLILQTFNPKNTTVNSISESDLSLISQDIFKESQKIQIQLKNEVFSLRKKRQIRLLVRKYHSTLTFLLDNVIENRKNSIFQASDLSGTIDTIIDSLDELLSFVETRFSNYLSLDERVPITYLIVTKKEVELKLDNLKKKKITNECHRNVMEIVLDILYKIVKEERGYKVTYRQILYQKELLKLVDGLNYSESMSSIYCTFDVLLISLNFNNIEYINYLITRISNDLNSQETIAEKRSKLLWHFKEFSQLYSNEKIMFEPSQQNIKEVLNNWFKHEIAYLKGGMEFTQETKSDFTSKQISTTVSEENKIECVLSTDQMGLILRATDESRIIKARSMSQIFKTIVPHLSTPYKKDLSYQSVRSKSYNAEERDKEIAIQTLEKIIKKIKTY